MVPVNKQWLETTRAANRKRLGLGSLGEATPVRANPTSFPSDQELIQAGVDPAAVKAEILSPEFGAEVRRKLDNEVMALLNAEEGVLDKTPPAVTYMLIAAGALVTSAVVYKLTKALTS